MSVARLWLDALGRQDIYHLREYLARSRVTPSQYEAQRKG